MELLFNFLGAAITLLLLFYFFNQSPYLLELFTKKNEKALVKMFIPVLFIKDNKGPSVIKLNVPEAFAYPHNGITFIHQNEVV